MSRRTRSSTKPKQPLQISDTSNQLPVRIEASQQSKRTRRNDAKASTTSIARLQSTNVDALSFRAPLIFDATQNDKNMSPAEENVANTDSALQIFASSANTTPASHEKEQLSPRPDDWPRTFRESNVLVEQAELCSTLSRVSKDDGQADDSSLSMKNSDCGAPAKILETELTAPVTPPESLFDCSRRNQRMESLVQIKSCFNNSANLVSGQNNISAYTALDLIAVCISFEHEEADYSTIRHFVLSRLPGLGEGALKEMLVEAPIVSVLRVIEVTDGVGYNWNNVTFAYCAEEDDQSTERPAMVTWLQGQIAFNTLRRYMQQVHVEGQGFVWISK